MCRVGKTFYTLLSPQYRNTNEKLMQPLYGEKHPDEEDHEVGIKTEPKPLKCMKYCSLNKDMSRIYRMIRPVLGISICTLRS